MSNVGFALGGLISGLAIAADSTGVLYGLLAFDAATFCFGAFATARLPEVERARRAVVPPSTPSTTMGTWRSGS